MSDALINEDAINQLLEMDDGDNHDFSSEILTQFFDQVDTKTPEFDTFFQNKDWDSIGKLGHFFKGSAAGVGAQKLKDICDDIQHYHLMTDDPESYLRDKISQFKKYVLPTKSALYGRIGM